MDQYAIDLLILIEKSKWPFSFSVIVVVVVMVVFVVVLVVVVVAVVGFVLSFLVWYFDVLINN